MSVPTGSATSPIAVEEYRALRATIRERGTVRLIVTALTFFVWPPLLASIASPPAPPWLALLPLVVLWGGFEAIYALHVGVERVGRYLQLHYEAADTLPAWERTAMQLGTLPGATTGADPLLFRLFLLATLVDLAPLVPVAARVEDSTVLTVQLVVVSLLHFAFLMRVLQARRFAIAQRARDLHLFTQLRDGRGPVQAPPA